MKMKKVANIRLLTLVMLVVACLSACIRDVAEECGAGSVKPGNADTYVTFNLQLASTSTRGITSEGQDGDEFEQGFDKEDQVDDIAFFLFNMKDWNVDGSTPCRFKGHLDPDNCVEWKKANDGLNIKFSLAGYQPEEDDRVIVLANTGAHFDNIENLSQLRDTMGYQTWHEGNSLPECDHFVLTSSYNDPDNGKIVFQGKAGSREDPYVSGVKLQRMAARIDFQFDPVKNVSGSAPYSSFDYKVNRVAGDESSELLANMHILNVIPFNVKQIGSFILRRTTERGDVQGNGSMLYGGHEYRDNDGVPVNCVIEPHTLSKGVTDAEHLDNWFGNTRASKVFASPSAYLTGTDVSTFSQNIRKMSGDTFVTVGYANENTQPQKCFSENYVTGLLLRAVYVPQKVYSDAAASVLSTEDFSTGRTFWRFVPSHSTAMESDCAYFDNEAAANAHKASVAGGGVVTRYADGVCYYKVWIRHAVAPSLSDITDYPMKYGIVRNNVYRVKVEYVAGPGTPLPGDPDTGNASMRIYVKMWNKRVQPSIRL